MVRTDRKLELPLASEAVVCEYWTVARTAVPDVVSRNTVMSARQWRARGISPPLLRSLVRSGELIRMRQGVSATKRAADWAAADPVRAHALKVLAAMATAGAAGAAGAAGGN